MRFGSGRRRGKGTERSRIPGFEVGIRPGGPPTNCICPACGFVVPHEPGVPCFQRRCPNCGSPMARQFLRSDQG